MCCRIQWRVRQISSGLTSAGRASFRGLCRRAATFVCPGLTRARSRATCRPASRQMRRGQRIAQVAPPSQQAAKAKHDRPAHNEARLVVVRLIIARTKQRPTSLCFVLRPPWRRASADPNAARARTQTARPRRQTSLGGARRKRLFAFGAVQSSQSAHRRLEMVLKHD